MSFSSFMVTSPWVFFLLMETPMVMLLIIDILYFVFYMFPYFFAPFHVTVFEQRGEKGLKARKVYGKIVKDEKGMPSVRLTGFKRNIEMPALDNLVPINNRQDMYCLYRDSAGNFRPMNTIEVTGALKNIRLLIEDKDVARWAQQERKQALERLLKKEESFWKQYFPHIGLTVIFVVSIMAFILIGHYSTALVERSAGMASDTANKNIEVANKYAQMFLYVMGEQLPAGGNVLMPAVVPQNTNSTIPTKQPGFSFGGLLPT